MPVRRGARHNGAQRSSPIDYFGLPRERTVIVGSDEPI
jgi:hypothetical protein